LSRGRALRGCGAARRVGRTRRSNRTGAASGDATGPHRTARCASGCSGTAPLPPVAGLYRIRTAPGATRHKARRSLSAIGALSEHSRARGVSPQATADKQGAAPIIPRATRPTTSGSPPRAMPWRDAALAFADSLTEGRNRRSSARRSRSTQAAAAAKEHAERGCRSLEAVLLRSWRVGVLGLRGRQMWGTTHKVTLRQGARRPHEATEPTSRE